MGCSSAGSDGAEAIAPSVDSGVVSADTGPSNGPQDVESDATGTGLDTAQDTVEDAAPEACAALAPDCAAVGRGCVPPEAGAPARCELCPEGQYPSGPLAACAPIGGAVRSYDFVTITIESGAEHSGWCQSWVLNNPEPLWVNAVEFVSGGGYHHSNWFFVPEGEFDYPEGLWKGCYSNGFHEVDAALAGGVLFAQSTQVAREVQKFPEGAAVRIPPFSRIIGATHLLNVFPEPLTTPLKLNLYTVDEVEVTVPLTPLRISYLDLAIPAGGKASFGSECPMRQAYESVAEKPFDVKLYYAMPHYHAQGAGFELKLMGGPKDGQAIFDLGAFTSDPFGRVFDPPIDLGQADGLSFRCVYNNALDKPLKWGIGDNEMCVMLGFIASDLAFDMSVLTTTEVVEAPDGERQGTGPCAVIGFPFDQDKQGGSAEGDAPSP
jgi:hypothetical protein